LQDRGLGGTPKLRVLGQEGCYHGDTLGAMNVAVPSTFNDGQHPWFESKVCRSSFFFLFCFVFP
jgi:adenosylmethionine-8-amino-7-oxononanoate aminotransferase